MKKNGFTLLEISIVLAVISILFVIWSKVLVQGKKTVDELEVKGTLNSISELLSLGKHYCFNKEIRGRIEVIKSTNTIRLIDENLPSGKGVIRSVTLPVGYEFLSEYKITITSTGVLSSNTICIKDNLNRYQEITIGVGVDLITVY